MHTFWLTHLSEYSHSQAQQALLTPKLPANTSLCLTHAYPSGIHLSDPKTVQTATVMEQLPDYNTITYFATVTYVAEELQH